METHQVKTSSFNVIKLIFFGLLSGQVLFLGVAIYLNQSFSIIFNEDNVMIYILPCMAIASIFIGNFIFNQSITNTKSKNTFQEKINGYLSASIIKFALVEGVSLLSIVNYLISGNFIFIIIAIFLIFYFFTLQPSKEKVITTLKLSAEERKLI